MISMDISLIVLSTPLCGPILFDIFIDNEETIPVVGTMNRKEVELQDNNILFDQHLK